MVSGSQTYGYEHGSESPVVRTGEHPRLHPGWKILPTRMGCCSNINCNHRFPCKDNYVDLAHVQQAEPCHQWGKVARRSSFAFRFLALCLNNNYNTLPPSKVGHLRPLRGLHNLRPGHCLKRHAANKARRTLFCRKHSSAIVSHSIINLFTKFLHLE